MPFVNDRRRAVVTIAVVDNNPHPVVGRDGRNPVRRYSPSPGDRRHGKAPARLARVAEPARATSTAAHMLAGALPPSPVATAAAGPVLAAARSSSAVCIWATQQHPAANQRDRFSKQTIQHRQLPRSLGSSQDSIYRPPRPVFNRGIPPRRRTTGPLVPKRGKQQV